MSGQSHEHWLTLLGLGPLHNLSRPERYAAFASQRRSSRNSFPLPKRGLIPLVRVTPKPSFSNHALYRMAPC